MEKMSQQLWIKKQGDLYTIGLTPELQDDAGDICYANITSDKTIAVDGTLFNVEASKAAIEIPSPLTGRIVKINQAALDNPALLNSEDRSENWVAVLTDVDEAQFNTL